MERIYKYPVWGTQGGGLVREVNGTYIFIEKPDCPGLDIGDEMPEEWGIIPANWLARKIMKRVACDPLDEAMFNADFDMLFKEAEAGEISGGELEQFFPDNVRE